MHEYRGRRTIVGSYGNEPRGPRADERGVPVSREIAELLGRPGCEIVRGTAHKRRVTEIFARHPVVRVCAPLAAEAYGAAASAYARAIAPRLGSGRPGMLSERIRQADDAHQEARDTVEGDGHYERAKHLLHAALVADPDLARRLREEPFTIAVPQRDFSDERPQSIEPYSLHEAASRAIDTGRTYRSGRPEKSDRG